MVRKTQLEEAEILLRECLEAFSNIGPRRLFQRGCFNPGTTLAGPGCPCTACKVRRYLAGT